MVAPQRDREVIIKKYAIVGLGHRSSLFSTAIIGRFSTEAALVGLCDTNQTRMDYYNGVFAALYGAPPIPSNGPTPLTA